MLHGRVYSSVCWCNKWQQHTSVCVHAEMARDILLCQRKNATPTLVLQLTNNTNTILERSLQSVQHPACSTTRYQNHKKQQKSLFIKINSPIWIRSDKTGQKDMNNRQKLKKESENLTDPRGHCPHLHIMAKISHLFHLYMTLNPHVVQSTCAED